jgi:hypothetical protein
MCAALTTRRAGDEHARLARYAAGAREAADS